MGESLRLAIGIMGNAASLLLYATPILTFKRIINKQSTQEFSCIPYILALLNSLIYTWYGLPIVSVKWENFPVVSINGLGIPLEISFIVIYIWFASVWKKKQVCLMVASVVMTFCITVLVSSFALHEHRYRKMLVGSVGLVASVGMYASPLVAVRQVIQTKSVEFMPFYLSFFSFLSSSLWMAYGLLGHDLFLASPNLVGSPLGVIQLVLYFMYRKKKGDPDPQRPIKSDLEKNELQLNSQKAIVNGIKEAKN